VLCLAAAPTASRPFFVAAAIINFWLEHSGAPKLFPFEFARQSDFQVESFFASCYASSALKGIQQQ